MMFALMLSLAAIFNTAAAAVTACGGLSTVKPKLNDTCATLAGSSATVDVAAARGELEAAIVLLEGDATAAGLSVVWSGAEPLGVSYSVALIGFVHTEASPRYAGSIAGWFADPLLPWSSATRVSPNASRAALVTFNVSTSAVPGTYHGTINVTDQGVQATQLALLLTVWPIVIPPPGSSPFATAYAFDDSAPTRFYGADDIDVNATTLRFYELLAGLRFPATNIYASAPLPSWKYSLLGAEGARALILADISSLPFDGIAAADDGDAAGHRVGLRSTSRAAETAPAAVACPTFSQAYIDSMVSLLTPAWEALGTLGLRDRTVGLRDRAGDAWSP